MIETMDCVNMVDTIKSVAQNELDAIHPNTYKVLIIKNHRFFGLSFKQASIIIMEKVCDFFEIDKIEFNGRSRKREYVDARRMYSYYLILLFNRQQGISYKTIGRTIGRDHATMLHNKKSHEALILTDQDYSYQFNQLLKYLDK